MKGNLQKATMKRTSHLNGVSNPVLCLLQAVFCTPRLAALTLLLLILLAPTHAQAQGDGLQQRLERAAALIRDERTAEAERQLGEILKATPNRAEALNLLGTIRAKQGRLEEAELLFTRAARSDKGYVAVHMNLAYLYVLKGQPSKTASELREVLRLDPSNEDAGYKLARLLLSQNRADECVALLEGLRRTRTLSPALLVVLGDAYLKKGDAGKAEEGYLLALVGQSDYADALLGMALISQLKGDAQASALYLFRVKEQAADSPDMLYRYALAALKLGRHEEALSALQRVVQLRPEEPAYLLTLGATWLTKPDLAEAEQAFRRLLKLQPENAQGQLHLGYVLLKQKRYPEARELLERSVRQDASAPEPFYYLGVIAQEQNEDARAVEILEPAVRRFPGYVNAHVALGSSYMKLKNYPLAQKELELSVRLKPDESKAHYNLALLYARLKDPRRAQEEMRIVEKLKGGGDARAKEEGAPPPSTPNPR
jgi:predicted Zn-dependent protease